MRSTILSFTSLIIASALFGQTTPPVKPPAQNTVPNTGQRVPDNLRSPADPNIPTIWLVGDSTVRNGAADGANGQWGWGEPLAAYFDPAQVNLVNRAMGGLSSRTYLTGGNWERVIALAQPGDFILMQFGHNDAGPVNDNSRARGTLPGIGAETQSIDNMLTRKPEVVQTYGWYLRRFITDAKAKKVTPIVCSPVPRKNWKDGSIQREQNTYAGWAKSIAAAEGVPFIDLNEMIAKRYEQLGPQKVEPLFADEHTHTSRAGAELNAQAVVLGLNSLPGKPLVSHLSQKGKQLITEGWK
ncbi:MAG TPA: rhamnogalacturonan acetylesterase [Bryobacteraceae bacterium]|nr:rhamnogalacturonan acetylesterase [Bryobacteraceae bacterium]